PGARITISGLLALRGDHLRRAPRWGRPPAGRGVQLRARGVADAAGGRGRAPPTAPYHRPPWHRPHSPAGTRPDGDGRELPRRAGRALVVVGVVGSRPVGALRLLLSRLGGHRLARTSLRRVIGDPTGG